MEEYKQFKTEEEIKDFLVNRINLEKMKYRKPFVIGFIGYPGSGKSTAAKILSEKLDLYVLSSDFVRILVRASKIDDNSKPNVERIVREVFYSRREILIKNKVSFIMDGNIVGRHEDLTKYFTKLGYNLVTVKLECSDETCMKRLKNRKNDIVDENIDSFNGDIGNYSVVTENEYYEKKMLKTEVTSNELIYATIHMENTDEEINKEFEKLIEAIEQNHK